MESIIFCPIWGTVCSSVVVSGNWSIDSPRAGGKFLASNTLVAVLSRQELSATHKVSLTERICQKRLSEDVPLIRASDLEKLQDTYLSISERRDRILLWIEKRTNSIGQQIAISPYSAEKIKRSNLDSQNLSAVPELARLYEISAACAVQNTDETQTLIGFCIDQQLLKKGTSSTLELTYEGLSHLEKIRQTLTDSSSAFVAMWFGSPMSDVYENGIRLAIEDAGYKPVRIDRIEHNNKIDDEIISEIRRSKFVVADFTSELIDRKFNDGKDTKVALARGGVYFEAGFALGLGKPVIWCVRKDIVDAKELHFDTQQYAHIVWERPDELRSKLAKRITATLDYGPLAKKV
jgi:nucleoside 2-deoxyribosyltransferase